MNKKFREIEALIDAGDKEAAKQKLAELEQIILVDLKDLHPIIRAYKFFRQWEKPDLDVTEAHDGWHDPSETGG